MQHLGGDWGGLIWVCEDGVIGNEMRTTPSEALCTCKASEKTEEGCLSTL